MQPKAYICRMAMKRKTLEPEIRSQANSVSQTADPSPSSITSSMSVSTVCENQNPLVSLEAIASQMRLGRVYEEAIQSASRVTPQPTATWEHPEPSLLSDYSSALSETRTTPTPSERVRPQDEDETPRSLKRKRQPPRLRKTPSSSTRTTPAHSPGTVAATPGSPDVARKIRSLRYVTIKLCK
jgi:hypothetical protein